MTKLKTNLSTKKNQIYMRSPKGDTFHSSPLENVIKANVSEESDLCCVIYLLKYNP